MNRIAVAVVTALAALALTAPAASACAGQPLSQPFLPWQDFAFYEPAPDGGLEDGAGEWTLSGGAALAGEQQPYLPGASSLSLPPGAVATTPPACITVAHPTVRLFARNSGAPLASLAVSVVFRDVLGLPHELPVGALLSGAEWAPTPILAVVVNLLGAREVRFRFRPLGGAWRIDDVFVDPYSKG